VKLVVYWASCWVAALHLAGACSMACSCVCCACALLILQRGEVEYSLRAIPLGGYVAFPDDDPKNSSYKSDDPDLLQNRPVPARALVISAGVMANIVFSLAVLFAQVSAAAVAQAAQPPHYGSIVRCWQGILSAAEELRRKCRLSPVM